MDSFGLETGDDVYTTTKPTTTPNDSEEIVPAPKPAAVFQGPTKSPIVADGDSSAVAGGDSTTAAHGDSPAVADGHSAAVFHTDSVVNDGDSPAAVQ